MHIWRLHDDRHRTRPAAGVFVHDMCVVMCSSVLCTVALCFKSPN